MLCAFTCVQLSSFIASYLNTVWISWTETSLSVNCISAEARNLAGVKRCVNADCRCQWKIYLRCFGEFNIVAVIRERNLSHEVSRMESGFYFVVMLIVKFCGPFFLPDGISSNWILISYNNWVYYTISNNGKDKDRVNCGDTWSNSATCAASEILSRCGSFAKSDFNKLQVLWIVKTWIIWRMDMNVLRSMKIYFPEKVSLTGKCLLYVAQLTVSCGWLRNY